tara:strand:+ start:4435 stop:4812 length:378 start_codon:yes stop_codon:yes gene_type:complete
MKLIQRIGYYLGGFSLGLIILAFFLSGKKTSCSYGPDARVLKNINSKTLKYSDEVLGVMNDKNIDSTIIRHALSKGDINFNNEKTEPRKEPCGIYYIEDEFNKKSIALVVENCDSTATLLNLYIE